MLKAYPPEIWAEAWGERAKIAAWIRGAIRRRRCRWVSADELLIVGLLAYCRARERADPDSPHGRDALACRYVSRAAVAEAMAVRAIVHVPANRRTTRHEYAAIREDDADRRGGMPAASESESPARSLLRPLLATLSRRVRLAIELRYGLGREGDPRLSPAEVAAALGVGTEAIRKRLARGIDSLRRAAASGTIA